ncbi:methyl-accepting chemotaxis protein [Leptothoe sp. PORK10 BA2]|uniref:methyl-accepting chemotaxis protein n=1 Tax=Leptothoe sp. PORK10 BA2 TaxID=3110254 RepID=UPI002B2025E8|nr:HAMP domain-containing methyl-accepting chemotaxis protein [Leptothoe sp. PORK10 BA2]MEA5466304.1 HAMP domain-containing methyl-accepting chemotaxis protein [Leptothoe sp. PORK10 BA2]
MTAQQYPLDDRPQMKNRSQKQGLPMSTVASVRGQPLGRQLLQTLLPVALLPLAVASGLGFWVTRRAERADALFLLTEESFLASEAASLFVEDNFGDVNERLLNPIVTQALQQADEKVKADNLAERPIEQLNQEFGQTKLVTPNPVLNKYLTQLTEVKGLAETIITERNGLNVGYSKRTSDFVQRDEEWWIEAQKAGKSIAPATFDESSGAFAISLASALTSEGSNDFLGVMRKLVPTDVLNRQIATYVTASISGTQQVQVIDIRNGVPFSTINADGVVPGEVELIGGESVLAIARGLQEHFEHEHEAGSEESTDVLKEELIALGGAKIIEVNRVETEVGQEILSVLLETQDKDFSLSTVPGTPWVAISSVDLAQINSAGNDLLIVFALTALILGTAVALVLQLFAKQLSAPLQVLTTTAQTATAGNLEARASIEGTSETQILGQSFNQLLEQIQTLLNRQQELTDEQRQEREALENEISQLMEDVGGAADGDLSVRAKLVPGDVGIVADLFNAVIENLRDIATNVKQSTGDVSQSLLSNEEQMRSLAERAITEVSSLRTAMDAVQEMDQSIQTVADNASQASTLTNDTYATAQAGSQSMEETAGSILELRSTVGEAAKKIKRLGESAQKIAQAVSLIDEIALKTNLLAVNASVEASRAGELGQGFTAVAEQVGSLAEQSAGATKTIAQIVAEIQTETQEVVAAIEIGTSQVVDSSQRVKATQQQLEQVLAKSAQINQLMQEISASTANQSMVSKAVTELVQKATQTSEEQSQSSTQVAQAIQATAKVAQELQASVAQFKVEG